jgi:hypothetical protein
VQNRPYYFVGGPLFTQSFDSYIKEYDTVTDKKHPITTSRLRGTVNHAELDVNESLEALEKFQTPFLGLGWEAFERSTYRTPIFTVFIPDSAHLQFQSPGCYKIQRKYVVIHDVKVCGESYIYAFYPSAYRALANTGSSDAIVTGIRNLFHDYSHPRFGLFLTLHWNRHYIALADQIVKEMPATMQEAYEYLRVHRRYLVKSDKTNLTGSFMRRLDYAIGQLITEMNKNNEPALQVKP